MTYAERLREAEMWIKTHPKEVCRNGFTDDDLAALLAGAEALEQVAQHEARVRELEVEIEQLRNCPLINNEVPPKLAELFEARWAKRVKELEAERDLLAEKVRRMERVDAKFQDAQRGKA